MAKIGLYVYELRLKGKEDFKDKSYDDPEVGQTLHDFVPNFVRRRSFAEQNEEAERSWSMLPSPDNGRARHGRITYGVFGVDSKIRDTQTDQVILDRKETHVEETPLYYYIWTPPSGKVGYAAFQSYKNRSCARMVLQALVGEFAEADLGVRINPRKIMPASETTYANQPVKKLVLYKRRIRSDAIELLRNVPPDEVNVELSFAPRRGRGFGPFGNLAEALRGQSAGQAFAFEGIEFDEASAVVKIGGQLKKVGIIGPANSAGVIDITDDIEYGTDNHPTIESMHTATSSIISGLRRDLGLR